MIKSIKKIIILTLPFFLFGQYEQTIGETIKCPMVNGDSMSGYIEITPVKTIVFFKLDNKKYEYTLKTDLGRDPLPYLYYSDIPQGWAQKLYILISQTNNKQYVQAALDSNIDILSISVFRNDNYENNLKLVFSDDTNQFHYRTRLDIINSINKKINDWLSQIDSMTDNQLEYILMDFDFKYIQLPLWSSYLVSSRNTPNLIYAKAAIEYANRVSAYLVKKKWRFVQKDIYDITHKSVILLCAVPLAGRYLNDTAGCDKAVEYTYSKMTEWKGNRIIVSADDEHNARIIKTRYQKFGRKYLEILNELKELVYINSGYIYKIQH